MSVATELTEWGTVEPAPHPHATPRPRGAAAARARLAAAPAPVDEPGKPAPHLSFPGRETGVTSTGVRSTGVPSTGVPSAGGATVAVLRSPAAAGAARPVRLTRRGVTVLTAAVIAVCGAIWWLAALSGGDAASGAASGATSGAVGASAPRAVTVAPGDTLWSIASRVAPQRDPRAEVSRLQRRNHLVDAAIVPGQTLVVP